MVKGKHEFGLKSMLSRLALLYFSTTISTGALRLRSIDTDLSFSNYSDVSTNSLKGEFLHGGAVLDCCFHDDSSGFSVGSDNKVRWYCESIVDFGFLHI